MTREDELRNYFEIASELRRLKALPHTYENDVLLIYTLEDIEFMIDSACTTNVRRKFQELLTEAVGVEPDCVALPQVPA